MMSQSAHRTGFVLSLLLLTGTAGAQTAAIGDGKIVDLTHPFSSETVYWPTAEKFALRVDAAGVTDQGYYYAANSFCAAEHGGTHVDAPVHFAEGKNTVDQIELRRLVASALLIDVAAQASQDADYLISVRDLENWEDRHGRIPDGFIVLFRTGWGARYPDLEKYLGTSEKGPQAAAKLHFPGLHPEAALWLVENRDVAAVGLDTASIDHGPSQTFESHRILFKANIPAFENLANLESLPETGFQVIALPMKIAGGSGGPLRIIAIFP